MRHFTFLWLITLILAGAVSAAPTAPDYRQNDAWAASPDASSDAQLLPPNVAVVHRDDVAVFFVHPTTYLGSQINNADFDAGGETRERLDNGVLRNQVSIFNFTPHLYVPRYRQASLKAITSNDAAAYAVTDLAYQDVARAFNAFLAREPDRPFIIASHSQGSVHALRLVQQVIAGTPLQRRMVAAYLAGVALPRDIESRGLPLCHTAADTGCLMAWNSERSGHDDPRRRNEAVIWWDGHYQAIGGRALTCFNPLTRSLDASATPADNHGALPKGSHTATMPAVIIGRISAQCENGLLGVDIPLSLRHAFSDILTMIGIYHDYDFNLFYVNLRDDAMHRTDLWLANH